MSDSRSAIEKFGISTSLVIIVIIIIVVASIGAVILATSTSIHTEPLISLQTTVTSTTSAVTSAQTQISTSQVVSISTTTTSTFTSVKSASQSGPHVSIVNFAFSPATITVVIGLNNTVTWTNYDTAAHTVTSINGTFDSGNLNTNQSWTHTFTTPGTYAYDCSYHVWMTGTVIVKSD